MATKKKSSHQGTKGESCILKKGYRYAKGGRIVRVKPAPKKKKKK